MGQFTSTAVRALQQRNVQQYVRVTIGGSPIPIGRIMSYGYSQSKDFASDQLSLVLDNRDGTYSANAWYNAEILLYMGVQISGSIEEQCRFRGLIRQINTVHEGGRNVINLTAFDYMVRLQELEIETRFEATKTSVVSESPTVNYISFAASINGTPTKTSIVYDGETNESELTAGDTLYNMSDDYSTRTVVSVDTGTSTITTSSSSDSWANDDVIVRSTRIQVLDLANTNIAQHPEPSIKIRNRDDDLEDPLYKGFEVMYEQGQIVLGRALNWAEYDITVSYSYYDSDDSLYVEDVIQTILTTVDGYGNTPFTVVDNLTETLSSMNNVSVDTLVSNTEIETIDGTAYDIGQLWYTTYNNITTALTSGNFTVPGGTIASIDLRYGRIVLDSAISTLSVVTCNVDYSFKTLQATGVQFNKIDLTYETIQDRLEGINQIRELVAPNYVFSTRGTNKIWGRYIFQKDTFDHKLEKIINLSYAEDVDVYTRVRLFGQNKNPKNILLDDDVSLVQDTSTYYGETSAGELTFESESGGWRTYTTGLGEGCRIISSHDGVTTWPVVYINNVPINNESHELLMQPVEVKLREEYKQECHSWCQKQKIRSFRKYWIYFSHSSIDPNHTIKLYSITGVLSKTLSANDSEVNYGEGYWFRDVGEGDASWVMTLATASYFIKYSLGQLNILWDEGKFKISTSMFSSNREDLVTATYTYSAVYQPIGDVLELLIDGRWDTQVQTVFVAKPATGFLWAVIDLGAVKDIDAVDLIGGFFYPEIDSPGRKHNITGWYTMYYSEDDVEDYTDATFTHLCAESENFKLEGGESISFERDKLGDSFQARYIKITIEDLEQIPYGDGIYAVAFTELRIYEDVVLTEEAFLVEDINNDDDNHLYDIDGLLAKIGDKLYKETVINENLSSAEKIQRHAKSLLREFTKNHAKLTGGAVYAPYLEVGQTINIVDNKNSIDTNYFIESLSCEDGKYNISFARYPRYKYLAGQDPGVARQ